MKDSKKNTASDKSRTITIIISIVIALILWSYVIIQVNPSKKETITKVPVQLLNIQSLTARELAISGDGEYLIDVVVEGKKADISKVKRDEIIAEVDLYGWSKGENYIPVNVKVPSTLKVLEVKSPKILVTIEDLVALSKPVVISYRGNFPGGTEEGDVDIRPAEIEITGAKSEVESVHEVKVYIEAGDITPEGAEIQGEAVPLTAGEIIVENVNLSSNYVSVFARLMQLKEVPLVVETVGSPKEGYGAEIAAPNAVIIKGSKADIKDVEFIMSEPIDMQTTTESSTVDLKLILPEKIELAKKNPKLVARVDIEAIATREFQYTSDDIIFEGLAHGRNVDIQAVDIIVSVTGRKDAIEQLMQNQVQLFVDIAGLDAGTVDVPLMITSDIGLHSFIISPEQITLVIVESEEENTGE